ncbi:tether containing UBX domain for GLUT4 [Toxorhynchites rutilus septentrionalis]|uniref:tether containing UBX domain for GLUT4 n=1 Tax=Toxorhynchites rutilus septentrionalis TaxID=329112 RepID=UPI00247AB173|nr:tether containing UBX domain for GLUT4 [Toxorhynchites rutilus septentrionalis]
MASKAVTVLTVNGRRQNVKVESNTTILEILEQVCRKYNFNAAEHDLKHHDKILDLSVMFRFSGLPNNAFLEMVPAKKIRVETNVMLAIQLEDGTRLEGAFQPSTSLLSIMKTLCEDKANVQSNPVLIYMRREVLWESMENTTLKSLGLTGGRAILRLLQRKPEELKMQAHVSAPLPQKEKQDDESETPTATEMKHEISKSENKDDPSKKEISTDSSPSSPSASKKSKPTVDSPESTPSTSAPKSVVSKQKEMEIPNSVVEATPESIIHILGDRDAIVFHLETAERSVFDVPDSFYEITIPDVRKMYVDLKNKIKEYEDTPLLTSEQRQLVDNRRERDNLARYENTVIRVQFPDRYVLQGKFKASERIADVITFVRNYLDDQSLDFHLYTTPPKEILPTDSDLVQARCIPQALLHFGCTQDNVPKFLNVNVYDQLSNAYGASVVAARSRSLLNMDSPAVASEIDGLDTIPDSEQLHGDDTATDVRNRMPNTNFRLSSVQTATCSTKLPKWFKPAGK